MSESTGALITVFSIPMNADSLAKAFTLTAAGSGRRIPGSVEPFGEVALVFRPRGRLPRGTRFIAKISTLATADTGAALPRAYQWSFQTAS